MPQVGKAVKETVRSNAGLPGAWPAVLGGLALVGFSLVHSSTFLALKTDGAIRERSGRFAATWAPLLLVPAAAWAVWVQLDRGGTWLSWALVALAVVGALAGWIAARARREGWAFAGYAGFILFGAAAVFAGMFPDVLPSTLDEAFSLTVFSAASGEYTLSVMTVVACIGLPIVIAYQAWSYWVFRRRLSPEMMPEPHAFLPAILRERADG